MNEWRAAIQDSRVVGELRLGEGYVDWTGRVSFVDPTLPDTPKQTYKLARLDYQGHTYEAWTQDGDTQPILDHLNSDHQPRLEPIATRAGAYPALQLNPLLNPAQKG